jgi:DNA polymerase-1
VNSLAKTKLDFIKIFLNYMTKNKIALIDGYGFVFRAYHSLPPLTRSDGTPIGAVYGFTNMLIRLLASLNVSHISVVFDSGSKTFRNEIYDKYKANRPPCPPDLVPQFPLIREVAEAFNLNILEKVGFEADDLIATIAKYVKKEDFDVIIVSSDKDLMQLIDDHILMFDAMKNRIIGREEVRDKFFVDPEKVLEVLSLIGDTSDNVPGVRGIGPKTAAELINHYGSTENLYNNLHEIKQIKRREMLEAGVDAVKLSKRLIALHENVPIEINMDDFAIQNIDPDKLIHFLHEQGFNSLVARMKKEFKIDGEDLFSPHSIIPKSENSAAKNSDSKTSHSLNSPQNRPPETKIIDSFAKINQIEVNNINQLKELVSQAFIDLALIIDIEFTSDKLPQTLILSSAGLDQKTIYYIPLDNSAADQPSDDLFAAPKKTVNMLTTNEVLAELKPILGDNSVIKIGYRIKEMMKFFTRNNVEISTFDDVAVMAYVLNSANDKCNLRNLINTYLQADIENNQFGISCDEIEKIPAIFENPEQKRNFYYFKNYALWNLHNLLKNKIFHEKLNLVYYRLERPLIAVLAAMETAGILVDKVKLKSLSDDFAVKIKRLAGEIYLMAGEEFNIGSPKQISQILFEKLSLKSGKKSKSGGFSTKVDILEELDAEGHMIAGKILEWRHISKLKSTYSDALQQQIDAKTGRVHSNFSNTSTITGRLSSVNPNLQNIPIRSEEGLKIRRAFVAPKNYRLVSADYSQIELRILAHMADIPNLKEAFIQGKDIHAITAAQIFNVPEDQVDSAMRRKAKAINFGIIYGISAFGLARQLKIPRSDAGNYIKAYFETYPGIQDYMSKYRELAKANGYVTTITGRKCYLPEINGKNAIMRGLAERLAINAPIQGSAADIIKKAMIDLSEILKEKNLAAKLILQVHDELILEVPENEIEQVGNLLKTTMENAFPMSLPIQADIKVGNYWGEKD